MDEQSAYYAVSGVCCSTEETVLRKRLDADLGPGAYRFNLVTGELRVADGVLPGRVMEAVQRAGFLAREKEDAPDKGGSLQQHRDELIACTAAVLWLGGTLLGGEDGWSPGRVLLGGAILLGGARIFRKAAAALRNRVLDMNVLMTAAVVGAVVIGRWSEAAAVVVLFAAALALEQYSTTRSRRAVQSLLALAPQQASVVRDGHELLVDAASIMPGEILLVRPGERIPLDGTVHQGISSVNEATITGEAAPAVKGPGSPVFGGGMNERGLLYIRVTHRYEDTTLARIVHLIEEAQHQRAPVQSFVDRFARVYTPAVFGLAIGVALIPPFVLGLAWEEWLYRALVLLVIACPCALVISTPVTLVSAMTNAARRGILVKGGKNLEELSRVRAMAFDKTGTLTEGRPRVTDLVILNSLDRSEVLRIVAAMEFHSEHHLASAVLEEATRAGVDHTTVSMEGFEALPGLGVQCRIDGATWFLGNERLAEERGFLTPRARDVVGQLREEGKTTMILGRHQEPLSVLAVRDTARRHSREAIKQLNAQGIEHTRLLSGDHDASAKAVGKELGVESALGSLLPEEKVTAVQNLKQQYGAVAMVGDGVNDAPALAAATVGIAMGGVGSDAAMETADVVLMADDLSQVSFLIALSRKTMTVIRQNIAFALGVKLLFLILSITGTSTLWMALLADDGAALAVILNGLRILSFKDSS
jgi:Cd2+/Zn2+-exporting ATPase